MCYIQAPQEDTHLEEMEEMQSRLDTQSSQIASLTAKLEEKDKELVFNERQLKEQKNMNAALENQLTEYMDALDHQNKVEFTCVHTYTCTCNSPASRISYHMHCTLLLWSFSLSLSLLPFPLFPPPLFVVETLRFVSYIYNHAFSKLKFFSMVECTAFCGHETEQQC